MKGKAYAATHPSIIRRGFTPILLLLVAASAFMASLSWPDDASAHCDSIEGPVVAAARAALEADDVRLILPYVQPESEAELTVAFEEAMGVRALGGDARELADRYFFETAVRLHREGEGAPYTGLKEAEDIPALAAADTALEGGSLDDVYLVLDSSIQAGVEERYQAVIEAREVEAREGTVEASRERADAELQFEQYIYGIELAASGEAGHVEGQADAPVEEGH